MTFLIENQLFFSYWTKYLHKVHKVDICETQEHNVHNVGLQSLVCIGNLRASELKQKILN